LVPYAGIVLSGDDAFISGNGSPETRARAVVESQMLSMRLHSAWIAGDNAFSTIRMTGGGSKSDDICKIVANIFQANVERISVSDSAALGAAMRSANAIDATPWEFMNEEFTAPSSIVTPDPSTAEIYKKSLAKFAELERNHTKITS
jgi:xylulokinase